MFLIRIAFCAYFLITGLWQTVFEFCIQTGECIHYSSGSF